MADAEIMISHDGEYYHVQCRTQANTEQAAEKLAADVLRFLTDEQRRKTLIRFGPSAASHTDFASGIISIRGRVRFSFKDEKGD